MFINGVHFRGRERNRWNNSTVPRIRTRYLAFKYCPSCAETNLYVVFEISERNIFRHMTAIKANHLLFLSRYKWCVAMETPGKVSLISSTEEVSVTVCVSLFHRRIDC